MARPHLLLTLVWLLSGPPLLAADVSITVAEPSGVPRRSWPVTSGIPFAAGELASAEKVALYNAAGEEVPLQAEALCLWPDQSVRWLLLDFQTDLAPHEQRPFTVRTGVSRKQVPQPLVLQQNGSSISAVTGPLQMQFSDKAGSLLGQVRLDRNGDGKFSMSEMIVSEGDSGIRLVDQEGHEFLLAPPEKIDVEASGPLRGSLRLEGTHQSGDQSRFRYVVRLHFYRGQPFVRCCYTFINDDQRSLMSSLSRLDLFVNERRGESSAPEADWGMLNHSLRSPVQSTVDRLFQRDDRHYELNGTDAGERAPGWSAAGSKEQGVAIGLREMWQNWPKSLSVSGGSQTIGICPELPTDLYANKSLEEENRLYYHIRDGFHTFKIGVARTHEFWFNFLDSQPSVAELGNFFQATEEPLLATCTPEYACSTLAAGNLLPADPAKYFGYDQWVDTSMKSHLARREKLREYGMLNYGDWFGERKVNWGNLEYDLAHGLFLQYLRTGDRRYFSRAEQAARHHIDVDVVHAVNPMLKNPYGPPPQVGEIWLHCLNHTGGYYDNAPLPVSRTYQMGHSTNFGHVWASGDFDYYHLTGDRRAREVAIQMADAMVRHMPMKYGTHIRELGWPTILVLSAYEATGDRKYLDAATRNWEVLRKNIDWQRGWVIELAKDHCRHKDQRCEGNVPFMEGLVLCGLARYHRATGNPEVLKAITVGIDQMIRECWEEDEQTFRYTACPLSSRRSYGLFMLSAEAMAYEADLTSNEEHLRILRAGFRSAVMGDRGTDFGKGAAQTIHFAPHAMFMLDPETGRKVSRGPVSLRP
ncbi:beta-L-arabinofuranosidase domain-containing protein [Planctomicrobium sp. SH664]|uniref:exo-rhamnogalacturonan lyase family protein n=1 Tax=Planctomicrobium sp. SH664 TaxID=3448125 RepID=UPI003F5BB5A6